MSSMKNINWRALLIAITSVIVLLGSVLVAIRLLSLYLQSTTDHMQESASAIGHFSIRHPARWLFQETPEGEKGDTTRVAILDYPSFPKLGTVGRFRRSVLSYSLIDEISVWGEQIAGKQQTYKPISIDSLVINGEETILRKYSWFTPANPFRISSMMLCYDNYRLHNHIGYIITLCVDAEDFDSIEPVFRQVIDSFTYRE